MLEESDAALASYPARCRLPGGVSQYAPLTAAQPRRTIAAAGIAPRLTPRSFTVRNLAARLDGGILSVPAFAGRRVGVKVRRWRRRGGGQR